MSGRRSVQNHNGLRVGTIRFESQSRIDSQHQQPLQTERDQFILHLYSQLALPCRLRQFEVLIQSFYVPADSGTNSSFGSNPRFVGIRIAEKCDEHFTGATGENQLKWGSSYRRFGKQKPRTIGEHSAERGK